MPEKKNESYVRSEKFSNVDNLFSLYFCAPKTKSASQAWIKPKILSTLGPNPAQTKKAGPTYNSGLQSNI